MHAILLPLQKEEWGKQPLHRSTVIGSYLGPHFLQMFTKAFIIYTFKDIDHESLGTIGQKDC